ncbi:hypothetical protein Pla111_26400 [Botrimarina hoheduenensis]|uniref:Uncharacterized protein n=1 Tax=Botrimarina hoheduenensis TaxID=2528000 RepID=A0A5C5VX23_9BACT|nr:hypothetical protein Pla111_26400 [Botrimarina hoheduenensis]
MRSAERSQDARTHDGVATVRSGLVRSVPAHGDHAHQGRHTCTESGTNGGTPSGPSREAIAGPCDRFNSSELADPYYPPRAESTKLVKPPTNGETRF